MKNCKIEHQMKQTITNENNILVLYNCFCILKSFLSNESSIQSITFDVKLLPALTTIFTCSQYQCQ